MDIAQVSAQFFSAAMPAVGVSAGVVGFLLVVSGCALRWRVLVRFVKRFLLRQPQYNYRRIFVDYLERVGAITDRRELYPAILAAASRIVGASGASLVVRDAKDHFQIKSSNGLKPFSFEVEDVRPFLDWIEKHRRIVTRRDLVHTKAASGIKSEGLCYFVQFNAEACVPLFMNDRLYGVINLGSRGRAGYDGETRDLLKLMAVQFATAIHNANLYQALVRQNLNLQEASRFKTQLLANLSHELRTPLSSIIGLSELMAEGGDGSVNDEQVKHLSLIRQSGSRLLDAVTSMLDIAKLEVNRLDLNVQKVNIGRIVQQVAGELRLNDRTTIEIKVGEDAPGIYGDEKRVRQVVKHILGNAAKFTNRGKISVDAEKCGEMLKVRIKDTGPGIAREQQKAIFEGFKQADGGPARVHEGLGLGLAISKKLVELHGGRLWLASKQGRGSEFFFTLPLKPIGVFKKESSTKPTL
ncbi:MAG: GAF domain-containing sensor histidine kinase [Pseudomonadota bacterium]